MKLAAAALLIVIIAIVICGALVVYRGLSARSQPTFVEERIARTVRHLAVPAAMRNAHNPVPPTERAIADGRAHWADHCAICHANDGSGDTEMGRNMYPKVPDMRLPATQSLNDGELYSIIRNGVRLTGMPAWGAAAGRDDSDNWKLVLFIRHLPKLTPEEIEAMQQLNPKSPDEMKQMMQEDEFLHGH